MILQAHITHSTYGMLVTRTESESQLGPLIAGALIAMPVCFAALSSARWQVKTSITSPGPPLLARMCSKAGSHVVLS